MLSEWGFLVISMLHSSPPFNVWQGFIIKCYVESEQQCASGICGHGKKLP